MKQRKTWYRDEIWRDGPAFKNTCCSYRAPTFIFQDSQLTTICNSSLRCTHTCNAFIDIKYKSFVLKREIVWEKVDSNMRRLFRVLPVLIRVSYGDKTEGT